MNFRFRYIIYPILLFIWGYYYEGDVLTQALLLGVYFGIIELGLHYHNNKDKLWQIHLVQEKFNL